MSVEKDTAIVIGSLRLGEADRIITFCTAHYGKIRAVAKGVRRPKSPLAAGLELFNVGELIFFHKPNRDLHNINSFDVMEPIGSRMDDPLVVAYASYFSEIAREVALEEEDNPTLFALLRHGLTDMARLRTPLHLHRLARSFELKVLSLSGYQPHLDSCVLCGGALPKGEISVGLTTGGTLCEDHAPEDRTLQIGGATRQLAQRLLALPFSESEGLDLTRRQAWELRRMLSSFLITRLEKTLHSAEYIEMMEKDLSAEMREQKDEGTTS